MNSDISLEDRQPRLFWFLISGVSCFILFCSMQPLHAENVDALFEMPLEDLMNMKVTVASKLHETIADAPGSVTVYRAQDLERLGYYTLAELADITPGFSAYPIYGEKVFETRGQKAGSFNNNKHLLLVDGIPVHHARNYKVPTEYDMPLFFAGRAAFLRGPAAALYGVGAFYGVINVEPKIPAAEGASVESKLSAGGPDSTRRLMVNMMNKHALGASLLSVGVFSKSAVCEPAVRTDGCYRDNQESHFVYLKHRFEKNCLRGLGIGVLSSRKESGLGESWFGGYTSPLNSLTWNSLITYLKYDRQLTAAHGLQGYLKYNTSEETGRTGIPYPNESALTFSEYRSRVRNFGGELAYKWGVEEKQTLIAGLAYDTRQEEDGPDSYGLLVSANAGAPLVEEVFVETPWYETYSGFLQYKDAYDVCNGLLLTAGLRYDYGRVGSIQHYDHLSPRISLVQRFRDDFNVKLLYGTALRAPGIKEIELNRIVEEKSPGLTRPLKAERFQTLEFGGIYHTDVASLEVVAFLNETTDALDGVKRGEENIFINSAGVIDARGFEVDLRYRMSKSVSVQLNYAYADVRDEHGRSPDDIPTQKAAGMLLLKSDAVLPLNTAIVGRWVGGYTASNPARSRSGGYFVLDCNLVAGLAPNVRLEVQARNILDEQFRYPKYGIADVPMARRSVLATLSFRY